MIETSENRLCSAVDYGSQRFRSLERLDWTKHDVSVVALRDVVENTRTHSVAVPVRAHSAPPDATRLC